jgi:glycerol uptake facilitator-like aquaporin
MFGLRRLGAIIVMLSGYGHHAASQFMLCDRLGQTRMGSGGFASNGYGDLGPGKYGLVSCFLSEVIATFFFLYVIIVTTSKGAAVGFAGIPIGLCLTLLFLIPVTNASVNPARSTGPALFAGGAYIAQLWLFWLAPIVGAAAAGMISRWQQAGRVVRADSSQRIRQAPVLRPGFLSGELTEAFGRMDAMAEMPIENLR